MEVRTRPTQPVDYATEEDFEVCRKLHKKFGTTYYFATQKFRPEVRDKVHALYGFVRIPDEWVDNPTSESPITQLRNFRRELILGYEGVRPNEPVLRAFVEIAMNCKMPIEEPLCFLDAMEMDLTKTRYNTYEELETYMRGSAAAVGVMMCHILGVGSNPAALEGAVALGNAMQMTNFLRDVGEDVGRGRIYLPLADLSAFRVSEEQVLKGTRSSHFVDLLKFEIERTRKLYRKAENAIPLLPNDAQKPILIALKLYERILDRIIERHYDVFEGRARTSKIEKLRVAASIMFGLA